MKTLIVNAFAILLLVVFMYGFVRFWIESGEKNDWCAPGKCAQVKEKKELRQRISELEKQLEKCGAK